eukprot:11828029-Ditylum_brightwellii.AAC.1
MEAINDDIGVLTNVFPCLNQILGEPATSPEKWADELSLQLTCGLVKDGGISNFLFVGSYRDNEIDTNHPLSIELNELESKKVHITTINLTSISKEDTNLMISDTIRMPQKQTGSLSDVVYKKTCGNVLLVTQFLRLLWEE